MLAHLRVTVGGHPYKSYTLAGRRGSRPLQKLYMGRVDLAFFVILCSINQRMDSRACWNVVYETQKSELNHLSRIRKGDIARQVTEIDRWFVTEQNCSFHRVA